ncbi:MAG: DNA polymerase III subunit gamma/tau [Puniceicoccales bacterium]|jgi:DNA polymerase-3 subunit gamma/tau|nr:DNA polymerase III subunit gamma/tau [Puniceicoccales bacterium]
MGENYQVIARRWRPKRFSELVGQESIVQTLENAIRFNRIAHAFLFIGPRGTGKTSTARLLAMALNAPEQPSIDANPNTEPCQSIFEGHCMDVIEIDGASNNSVEQVRNLREECQYVPTGCRFKIYILDEVHMLSQSAFNALLKTLEEPPEHVKFIFATTEAYKVPQTIASRCQRFEFKPISEEIITKKIQQIAQAENIQADLPALQAIARTADGGMRDAQSILDQLTSFGNNRITEADVVKAYGLVSAEEIEEILACVERADYQKITELAERFRYCNFSGILSSTTKALQKKLTHLENPIEIAKTLRLLDIIIANKDFIPGNDLIMFQLILFRAIEASEQRNIDRVIELLQNLQTHSAQNCDDTPLSHQEDTAIRKKNIKKHGYARDEFMETKEEFTRHSPESTNAEPQMPSKKTSPSQEIGDLSQLPQDTQEKLKNLFNIEK